MPNFDGGHYFFTALLPIDNRGIVEHGDFKSSPVHMVRDALEALPTALQTLTAEQVGVQSPFARSLRTHFLRLFVIDAPHYNGRTPTDSIASAIASTDLLKAQPSDQLACPYLAFVADFDPTEGAEEPRAWLDELWCLAKPELCSVFQYCYGFSVEGGATAFIDFVLKGQIETTMPFNDYWVGSPPLPSLSTIQLAAAPLVGLVAAIAITALEGWAWWAGFSLALILAAAGIVFDYVFVMQRGAKPFPTAPNSTLRDVLKALYLQQAFTRFAIDQQGASPAQLRAAFATFAAKVQPDDLDGPTQPPGVVRSCLLPRGVDA